MNGFDLEERLTEWLHEDVAGGPEEVLSGALVRTRSVSQRPAWLLALTGGWVPPTSSGWRTVMASRWLAILAVFALLVALLSTLLLAGALRTSMIPTLTASPSASATASPTASPTASATATVIPTVYASLAPPIAGASWSSLAWSRSDPTPFTSKYPLLEQEVVPFAGGFVAVGTEMGSPHRSAVVWISADGRSWERIPSGAQFDAAGMTDIASGPKGLVAVGNTDGGSGAAWRSADGRTWTRDSSQQFGGKPFRQVAVGPAGVVATYGYGNVALFSPAPDDWEPIDVLQGTLQVNDAWGDATQYVLVGSTSDDQGVVRSAAVRSTDGRVWDAIPVDAPGRAFWLVSQAPGGIALSGEAGPCKRPCPDEFLGPAYWRSAPDQSLQAMVVPDPGPSCWPFTSDSKRLVLVSSSAEVFVSGDGGDWWKATASSQADAPVSCLEPDHEFDVAIGSPGLVAIAEGNPGPVQLWFGAPGP